MWLVCQPYRSRKYRSSTLLRNMNGDVLFQNTQNCLTMAAGSDRQPIESSVPICGKPTINSLTKLTGVRNHIPYSDHNYGKPLTPPDSCSPDHQEEPDTGNEDEGFTRCICDFKHDDGYMICCDKCSAWQHVECVLGMKNNTEMPDTYLCDVCDPRPLDKKRAIQIQTKKIEEPTDEEDEEDGDVSDHDSDNTLSRVTLPNSTAMKENVLTKGKRKKRESARKLNQKEMKHNKRKRRKRKHITSTDTIPVDEETNGPWNINSPFPEHKHYEEAQKTVYIGNLENRSFPSLESNGILRPEQICKVVDVQPNKKGVVVTEDINGQQFIIECKGNLMLESKFKEDHPIFSKCDPFVLYYTKLELVMNFSVYGNDARFIRRSCSPTAEVRHVMVDNKPHLIVVSMSPLGKGAEVTLAFEFPFQEYRRQLECACAQDNCKVLKHNEAIQRVEQTNGFRSSKDEHGLVDSSLSNHMDSDSDGDSNAKDKRNRKKLSREDRKLQQYLRQIEKMEKTEKKKQQHSTGRDGRTGILTQRNYPEEYNGETPSKPGKGFRKQSLSQRQQRKIQAIRRGSRLPSCSSEPLSPEDNYSSAASTPTTPSVNVVEENIDHHHLDTPDNKSFKFPKFKKGSLNDVSASPVDVSRSNNPSPEATGYRSPSKSSFEARLLEVDEQSCDRLSNLHATINGAASPRTDPNCSPSPCHSTSASPTHSEIVDLPDMFSRHHLASPGGSSVASYILNSGLYRSNPTYTTLKKRWLLQYANERSTSKLTPPNGITTSVYRPSQITRVVYPPKTFPLPYKRRKLMEYQKTVNSSALQPPSVDAALLTTTGKSVPEISNAVSSFVKISSTMTSSLTTSPSTASSVTSLSMISPGKSLLVTSSMASVSTTSLNNLKSIPSCEANQTILTSTQTTTGSGDMLRVTGSEEASWRRRVSGGSDDTSVGRSSISSISSTDDIKMDATPCSSDSAKIELNPANAVGSSSEANRKPPTSQATQENPVRTNAECAMNREDTSRDKTAHVGSSGVVEGSGATSTTQTTPGGKKKVSLTEYLNRKRTTGSVVKKDTVPGSSSSDVTSTVQSRVSDTGSVTTNSDSVSSAVNYRRSLVTSVSTSGYGSTLTSTGISSSGSRGVMIEPVSPVEADRKDGDRHVLHNSVRALQSSSKVEREATPSLVSTSYHKYSRPVTEPGSNSDAMDIDDDDVPSSSTILENNAPVLSLPGARSVGVTSSNMVAGKSYSNIGQPIKYNVTSAQPLPGRQVTNSMIPPESHGRPPVPVSQIPNASLPLLPPHADYRPTSSRSSPFH